LVNLVPSLFKAYKLPDTFKVSAISSHNGIKATWAIGAAVYRASILQSVSLRDKVTASPTLRPTSGATQTRVCFALFFILILLLL